MIGKILLKLQELRDKILYEQGKKNIKLNPATHKYVGLNIVSKDKYFSEFKYDLGLDNNYVVITNKSSENCDNSSKSRKYPILFLNSETNELTSCKLMVNNRYISQTFDITKFEKIEYSNLDIKIYLNSLSSFDFYNQIIRNDDKSKLKTEVSSITDISKLNINATSNLHFCVFIKNDMVNPTRIERVRSAQFSATNNNSNQV